MRELGVFWHWEEFRVKQIWIKYLIVAFTLSYSYIYTSEKLHWVHLEKKEKSTNCVPMAARYSQNRRKKTAFMHIIRQTKIANQREFNKRHRHLKFCSVISCNWGLSLSFLNTKPGFYQFASSILFLGAQVLFIDVPHSMTSCIINSQYNKILNDSLSM